MIWQAALLLALYVVSSLTAAGWIVARWWRGLGRWTFALSCGPSGGFYFKRGAMVRLCLGRLALTWIREDLDALLDIVFSAYDFGYRVEAECSAADRSGRQDTRTPEPVAATPEEANP